MWNAHAHGFPHVIGVSAAHARSLERLKETAAAMLETLRANSGQGQPEAAAPVRRSAQPAGPPMTRS